MCSVWSADRRAVRSLSDGLCWLSAASLDHSAFCSSEAAHITSQLDRPASRDVERELSAAIVSLRAVCSQLPAAATLAHSRLDGCIAISQPTHHSTAAACWSGELAEWSGGTVSPAQLALSQ